MACCWQTDRPKGAAQTWAIRQQLKVARRVRDLAMFNCALDPKLRACDLVRLRVSDVAPSGALRQRSIVIHQKTGRPVPLEITEPARDAIAAWLRIRGDRDDGWLVPSRSRPGRHIGTSAVASMPGLSMAGPIDRCRTPRLWHAQLEAEELHRIFGRQTAAPHWPLNRQDSRRMSGDCRGLDDCEPGVRGLAGQAFSY
jgi:integrase